MKICLRVFIATVQTLLIPSASAVEIIGSAPAPSKICTDPIQVTERCNAAFGAGSRPCSSQDMKLATSVSGILSPNTSTPNLYTFLASPVAAAPSSDPDLPVVIDALGVSSQRARGGSDPCGYYQRTQGGNGDYIISSTRPSGTYIGALCCRESALLFTNGFE